MNQPSIPIREQQALEEVGRTAISRPAAIGMSLVFLLTVFGVGLLEPWVEDAGRETGASETVPDRGAILADFGSEVRSSLAIAREVGPVATNRSLLAAMHTFEDRLTEASFLRRWLLPPLQWRLARFAGLGNEQVYIGREGWLFFKPDVDHVSGPGFLDSRLLRERRRAGEAWSEAPEPDPLPALLDLDRQLRESGVDFLVVPIPVKPAIEAERFTARGVVRRSVLLNPSHRIFIEKLESAGIEVMDPGDLLQQGYLAKGEDRYLRADTHWTPQGLDEVARALADRVERVADLAAGEPGLYRRREVAVVGTGDLEEMLWLPPGEHWVDPQRVDVQLVSDRLGRRWRSTREAEILLLGDSFTNVYSEASLGWGAGAGLAEQLSFYLQRPLDRIAVNAGGALGSRRALARAIAEDRDRLAGKRLVIYQFATRELSQGDWRLIDLRGAGSGKR